MSHGITIRMVETAREYAAIDVGIVRFDEINEEDGEPIPLLQQTAGPISLSFTALKVMHADLSKKSLAIDVSIEVVK